uniref:Acylglycerol kinase, mitochondrial n=1 Tax=Gadus morhua TaxID=8049 RepID=A0A8C5BJB5_GADMO
MARVVKVFKTLRNHWKKSTFAVCEFGRQQISPQEQLKKATVILNPAACNGKAIKLFDKNAAPILHLAGVEITLVKTDFEGQAKKLMEFIEQTDMLIVAGGDGTLQEVVTGLLRRPDQAQMCNTPIGFIPLGSSNSLSPSLHLLNDNRVKHITSATLSILKGETVQLDVLEIKGEKEQPVFALMGLRWGAFRDAAATISKYWYMGPLKTKAAHWLSTLREWPLVREVSLSYLEPTLRPAELPTTRPPRASLPSRIMRRLKNYWSPPVEGNGMDGWGVCCDHAPAASSPSITESSNEKETDPTIFTEKSTTLEASVCQLKLPEDVGGFYNIDNEEYDAMPVEVRLLPRKLRFFINAERREQLLTQAQ